MSYLNFKKAIFQVFTSLHRTIAKWRNTAVNRRFGDAKTSAAEAVQKFNSDRKALSNQAKSAAELVGPWDQIEALARALNNAAQPAKDILTTMLLNDIKAKAEGYLNPDPDVLARLQERAVAETTRMTKVFEAELAATKATLTRIQRDLAVDLIKLLPDEREDRAALLWKFRSELKQLRRAMDQTPPDCATKAATAALKLAINSEYIARIQDREKAFDRNEAPIIRSKILRHRNEAKHIVPLFRKGEHVQRNALSVTFLDSDAHQIDQMVNGVMTVLDADGSIVLQTRNFEDGGSFGFEKNWYKVSFDLKQQVKEAQRLTDDIADQDTAPAALSGGARFCFVDQIKLSQTANDALRSNQQLSLSGNSNAVQYQLADFVSRMRGLTTQHVDLSIFAFEGMAEFAGLPHITGWLSAHDDRQISLNINEAGLTTIEITHEHPTPLERDAINMIRLVALFVVAIADQAVNGRGASARSYPRRLASDAHRIEIPDLCVWPLQIMEALGSSSTAARVQAAALKSNTVTCARVEDWMFGWDQVPDETAPLPKLLELRFHMATQKQIRIMQNLPNTTAGDREGLDSHAALTRLINWFAWTSLASIAIWIVTVVATTYFAERFSERELWVFSIAFFLIALWRFVLVSGLISVGRHRNMTGAKTSPWNKLRYRALNLSLLHRWNLLLSPLILIFLALTIALTVPSESQHWNLLEAIAPPSEIPADGASFAKALKSAVWALPIVGVGLLRQAYVILTQLLQERGRIRARERWLEALEANWKAGTNLPGSDGFTIVATLKDQIAALQTRFTAQRNRVVRLFGEQSATNGVLVALVTLLDPLNGMAPETGLDFDETKSMLTRLHQVSEAPTQHASDKTGSLAAAGALPAMVTPEVPSREVVDACETLLHQEGLIRDAQGGASFIHQSILNASLIKCLDANGAGSRITFTYLQEAMTQQHAYILETLQRIDGRLDSVVHQPVQNTYVCVFPNKRHCLQGSEVAVSTEGLGSVSFDLNTFIEQVETATVALERLEKRRPVILSADATALLADVAVANEVLAKSTMPRKIHIDARTGDAAQKINDLNRLVTSLPDEHGIQVIVDVTSAITELRSVLTEMQEIHNQSDVTLGVQSDIAITELQAVLSKLQEIRSMDHVTLQANVDNLYQQIGRARTLINSLPERRGVKLSGLLPWQVLNFEMNVTTDGGSGPDLGKCDLLASRQFARNAPLERGGGDVWDKKMWRFDPQTFGANAKDTLTKLLARDQGGKQIYVLGMTDGLGNPAHNSLLSQTRADFVVRAVKDLKLDIVPISLSIGETGWLTRHGLPNAEEDPARRAALIYACDRPANTRGIDLGPLR